MKSYTVQTIKTWVVLSIILGTTVLFVVGIPVVNDLDFSTVICFVWFAACLAGGYYLAKKVAVVPLQVTLTPGLLTIRSSKDGSEQQIPLEDIASYFYQAFNDNKTFRLRLHSGQKVTLAHSDMLCPDDDIAALAADFKSQVAAAAAGGASQPVPPQREKTFLEKPIVALAADVAGGANQRLPIQREKTFFEKPLANVVGWVVVVGLTYFSWYLFQNGVKDGKWGSVCLLYGNGLTYLGAWFAARSKSNSG